MNSVDLLITASTWVIPILAAITLHEAAHAYTAWALGDDTAYKLGRVTLNPIKHIDPIGTILIPGFLVLVGAPFIIGWAKAVPVDTRNFARPRKDMGHVALSGPLANILIAIIASMMMWLVVYMPDGAKYWYALTIFNCVSLNVFIALFNLIPIPPLDGSKIAIWLLPKQMGDQLESLQKYGMALLVGVLFILPAIGENAGLNLDIVQTMVMAPADKIMEPLAGLMELDWVKKELVAKASNGLIVD